MHQWGMSFLVAAVVGGMMATGALAQEMTADLANVMADVRKANPDKSALCAKGPDGWKATLAPIASEHAGGGRNRPDKIRDLVRDGMSLISKDCQG